MTRSDAEELAGRRLASKNYRARIQLVKNENRTEKQRARAEKKAKKAYDRFIDQQVILYEKKMEQQAADDISYYLEERSFVVYKPPVVKELYESKRPVRGCRSIYKSCKVVEKPAETVVLSGSEDYFLSDGTFAFPSETDHYDECIDINLSF